MEKLLALVEKLLAETNDKDTIVENLTNLNIEVVEFEEDR